MSISKLKICTYQHHVHLNQQVEKIIQTLTNKSNALSVQSLTIRFLVFEESFHFDWFDDNFGVWRSIKTL